MRVLLLVVTLVCLSNTGCASVRPMPRPAESRAIRAGEVYCIRGLLDVFSLGMNSLAEELRQRGVDAHAISGPTWPQLARDLADRHDRNGGSPPLVFVGHSYGADDAVRIARYLERRGVDVSLLVLLDATIPPRIPGNVERCVHLYQPTVAGDLLPFVFAGNPVAPTRENTRTQIVNRSLNEDAERVLAAGVDHFNIDKHSSIHRNVLEEILGVCPPRAEAVVRQSSGVQSTTSQGVR